MLAHGDGVRTGHPSLLHKTEAGLTRMGGSRELILETTIGYNAEIERKGEWRKKETNKQTNLKKWNQRCISRVASIPDVLVAPHLRFPRPALSLPTPHCYCCCCFPQGRSHPTHWDAVPCHSIPPQPTKNLRHKGTRKSLPLSFPLRHHFLSLLHFEVSDGGCNRAMRAIPEFHNPITTQNILHIPLSSVVAQNWWS